MKSYIKRILLVLVAYVVFSSLSYGRDAAGKEFTVVVDAGHGGKDIGAADNNTMEKNINLGVALQLESLIKKKLKDAKIVLTRNNDTYLTLQQRADVANAAKGDLFISIHTNSVDKNNKNRKSVSGSSVYALGLHKDDNNMQVARRENAVIELEKNFEQKYSGFDPSKDESYIIFEMAQKKNLSKSIKFAELAQKNLVKGGRANRGVHQAGFWVLWATSMPAVLIELDFICNPTSAAYMASEKGQKELAESIFKAVEAYYDDWTHMQLSAPSAKSISKSVPGKSMIETEETEVLSDVMSTNVPKVRASKRTTSSKVDKAPAVSSTNGYANGKRRRRSEEAKTQSDARNLETKSIPLHTAMERVGKPVKEEETPKVTSVKKESEVATTGKGKNKKEKKPKIKKEKNKKKDVVTEEAENKPVRSSKSHNAKVDKFVIVYKIQILASEDLLKQNNPRFHGLSPITTYKENNRYKYYYGESRDKEEIERLLKEVKKKIPDAFIVSSYKSK